jgi:hypothetical protein
MLRSSPRSGLIGWLILVSVLSAGAGFTRDAWDKPPEQWTQADAYQILQDSPWSPAKSRIEVSFTTLYKRDRLTRMPSDSPSAQSRKEREANVNLSGGKPLPAVSVLWWSARTVRLAQERLKELANSAPAGMPVPADTLADVVIVVEGSDALRIARAAGDDLRQSAYFEMPSGMALDASAVEVHEGEKAGDDYVAFHFPRRIEGQPTITPDMEKVVFRWKASAKDERAGQPDTISVRVAFEPRRMRAAGQPDL